MSSEDYIKGYNNGLIAGLTQKPLIFGLGAPNTRKTLSFVWDIPEDNYEVGIAPLDENKYTKGGINWGDGTVDEYKDGLGLSYRHTYSKAGSYKVIIESDTLRLYFNFLSGVSTALPNIVTQISIPAFIQGMETPSLLWNATNLKHVSLAEGLSYIKGKTQSSHILYIGAFGHCDGIEVVTIPSTLNDARCLFAYCHGLKTVFLTYGLQTISDYMFNNCSILNGLTIPNTVKKIGKYTFTSCPELKEVTYEGTTEEWNTVELDSDGVFDSGVVIHCTDGNITI